MAVACPRKTAPSTIGVPLTVRALASNDSPSGRAESVYDRLLPPVAAGHAQRLRGCRSRVASAKSSVPKMVCSLLGTLGRPEPLAVAVRGFGRVKRRLAAIVTASGQRAYASISCAGPLGETPVRCRVCLCRRACERSAGPLRNRLCLVNPLGRHVGAVPLPALTFCRRSPLAGPRLARAHRPLTHRVAIQIICCFLFAFSL